MAKSSRASVRKRNNQALRKTIFGPASDARTERLSAKLQELAAKPKPESEKAMDVNEDVNVEGTEAGQKPGEDVDVDMTVGNTISRKTAKKRESARIEKKMSRRKPRNRVVFAASAAKQKRIAQSKKRGV